MSSLLQPKIEADTPLPLSQFKRFLAVFHVIFLAGLAFSLILRWRRPGTVWGWQDGLLLGLVATQVLLYVLFFILLWKPPTAINWWLFYFGTSLAIWLAEWKIEAALQWTAWAYMGQMFGVLRPALSIPIAISVFAGYFAIRFDLKQMNVWEWVGAVSLVVNTTALGLFLHGVTRTSSERAKLIKELQAAQQELERSRDREAEMAALLERERLARDLHDSLGHGLVTLTVQLEAAQRLYAVDPVKASALMDEMKKLTRTSMEELRRSLSGLRTPALGQQPLKQAIETLCEETGKQSGLRSQCVIDGSTDRLTPNVAETLWRVAQEGVRNAVRHAQARTVLVNLRVAPGQALLTIVDDGVGLPSSAETKPGHFGLRGLRERIEGLGGTFSATTAPGSGTRLEAQVPIIQP
jgi:signal transduction histidine kinase